jgi:hypothetical protein
MLKKLNKIVIAALIVVFAVPVLSLAKPGPVILTGMERAEWHSSVIDPTRPTPLYGDAGFMYTLISAYRKLDTNVAGTLYYINRYDLRQNLEDGLGQSTNIFGVGVSQDITGKLHANYNYSHSATPGQDPVTGPKAISNRLSLSVIYKFNPGPANKFRYSLNTTYNTGTKFSLADPVVFDPTDNILNFGRSISEKFEIESNITKKFSCDAAYTFIGSVRENDPARGFYKEQIANQLELNLNFQVAKETRVVLGYMYLNNLYNGAFDDDKIIRLSVFQRIR